MKYFLILAAVLISLLACNKTEATPVGQATPASKYRFHTGGMSSFRLYEMHLDGARCFWSPTGYSGVMSCVIDPSSKFAGER